MNHRTNYQYSDCYNAQIYYVLNCNYDNLLTYYATSGLRKNNNKIYCRRNFVDVLGKIKEKS